MAKAKTERKDKLGVSHYKEYEPKSFGSRAAARRTDYSDSYEGGNDLWQLRDDGLLWTGDWGERTPAELLDECMSTMRDLLLEFPELKASHA